MLSWLEHHLAEDEEATVYIRTRNVLTADNVSRNLLGRVGFEPDGESDSFNTEKYEYVPVLDSKDLMTLEETGDMEDVRLSISVQMLREDELNKIDSNETQPPETQPPKRAKRRPPERAKRRPLRRSRALRPLRRKNRRLRLRPSRCSK